MGKSDAQTVQLFAIGDARIVTPKAVIDPSGQLVFALGVYLLLERRNPVPRRFLEELLWPTASDAAAAHRLRQTIFKLRQAGIPIQAAGKTSVVVGSTRVWLDFEDPDTREHLSLDVFSGFAPRFSTPYAHWFDSRKAAIEAGLMRKMLHDIGDQRASGRWIEVEQLARYILRFAPENEEATLALAESLAMRGDKIQGVRALDKYLAEVGTAQPDLRLSATMMRRRIGEHSTPAEHDASVETPLVGREHFLRELAGILQSAKRRIPLVALLYGEPGIGKSRLLRDFMSFAMLQGVSCHTVTCRSTDSSRPLAVLLDLIPLFRSMRGAIGSSPDTLEFFDTLIKHRPNRAAQLEVSRSELLNAGLDTALRDIVDAVVEESTIVIVIEDCQWMDPASAIALARLFQRLDHQRLVILLTSRGPLEGILSELSLREIPLTPLTPGASAELINLIVKAHGRELDSEYLGWCTKVAEGNPFFLHELANHWLQTGEEHTAPPSLATVLRQRLSRLSSHSLQLLQTCAILENHSTADNLEAVLGQPAHVFVHSIQELASAGMIAPGSDGDGSGSGRIASRHDLLSEVALRLLSPLAQGYLHRRAAKALEALNGTTGEASILWSCAKHWQLAGDTTQALRLATSCALHLLDSGLSSDAADAFGKAESYCVSDSERLSNLEGQATAYYRSSNWARATEAIDEARILKSRLQPTANGHDDLELMQLRADWQTMNWNGILSRSMVCLEAGEAEPRHRIEAGVMALMMLSFTGDKIRGTQTFHRIEHIGSKLEQDTDSFLQATMVFHTNWGSFTEATSAAFSLVRYQRERGDIGALFRCLCNASVTFRAAGRFQDATEHLMEALNLAEKHHLSLSKSRAIPMLANMALELGNNIEAKKWLHELKRCPVGHDDRLGLAEISAISARLALLEGRYDDAHTLVNCDLGYMRDDQVPHRRAYTAALRVAVELATARTACSESLSELEKAYLDSRANVFQAYPTYVLYAGLISARQARKAKMLLRQYISTYRREPWPAPEHLLASVMSTFEGSPKQILRLQRSAQS